MNENIDLTKILKDCPKGFEFYSTVYGKLLYNNMYVSSSASEIYFIHPNRRSITNDNPIIIEYLWDGKLYCGEGECTLFPSKDQRDWNKFSAPWYKKEQFDPHTLQPFDKVLVRDFDSDRWICRLFSYIVKDEESPYHYLCDSDSYIQCVPYNDDTKYLVGTANEAPEYYRYWED